MIFTSFSCQVTLYDNNQEYLAKAPQLIREELAKLVEQKLVRGSLNLDERLALIKTSNSLAECLEGVQHVQECVFESLPLKQELFEQVDKLLGANTNAAICSSTSFMLPSLVFERVSAERRGQCLVAHPINPPLHVRLVELVACPETREEILIRTRLFLDELGQKPVVLRKEVNGFALNRLQAAVFQESFRLIHDGVMTPDDVDTVVSDGLGPRYAFMGPWMTAHLNAAGVADYFERYADGLYSVSRDCTPLLRMEGEAAQQVVDAMNHEVPVERLADKLAWRDRCLIELARIKDSMGTGMK